MSKAVIATSDGSRLDKRSEQKLSELRQERDLLRKKLSRLESVKVIETDAAEIFDLEDKIEKTKRKIDRLEEELVASETEVPVRKTGQQRHGIQVELHNSIVEFLSSLPNIQDNFSQRALIYSAGLDTQLQDQIMFGGPPVQFIHLLVSTLSSYGRLEDGRNALEAVLESAKQYVGLDRIAYCDVLIQELRSGLNIEETYITHPSESPQQIDTSQEDKDDFSFLDRILKIIFAGSEKIYSLPELGQLLDDKQLFREGNSKELKISARGSKVKYILSSFREIAELIDNYTEATSHRTKNEQLIQLILKLRKLKNSPLIQKERYTQRLQENVEEWLQLVENEVSQRVQDEFREIPNPFIYGDPIYPEDAEVFVGRQDVVERIEKLVVTNPTKPTLFLYGKRRSGKTSTLVNLSRFIGTQVVCVFIDVQDMLFRESSEKFCLNLSKEIAKGIPQLKETWQQQDFATAPFSALGNFLDTAETFVSKREKKILLTFDEYERFDTRNKDILDTLRTIIQHRRSIIVLIAGSHRFEELKEISWSDYLISTQTVEISWLDKRSAYKLLTNPIEDFDLNYPNNMPEEILRLTHCQPYLLQAIAWHLVSYLNFHKRKQMKDDDLKLVLKDVLTSAEAYFVNCWADECDETERNILEQLILQGKDSIAFDPANKPLRSLLRKEILERTNSSLHFAVPLFKQWIQEKQLMMIS